MKLLVNNYEDYLADLATKAVKIKVLIAFLTEGGLKWLPKEVMKNTEFIIGIDLNITSPKAIKILLDNNAEVSIFHEDRKLFHPKAIYIKTTADEHLIIGSNNLTSSGISSNHELSISLTRNNINNQAFEDFFAHFNFLLKHRCCVIPDDDFFKKYEQSHIQGELNQLLNSQSSGLPKKNERISKNNYPNKINELSKFIELLSAEFPKLERGRDKNDIKKHPLKILNDEEFRPLFQEIVSKASNGRLEAGSNLNIGGNWYRIPNILASNELREPWERSYENGRLVLQIHFSDNYKKVYLSAVLQYNISRSDKTGKMPLNVAMRYDKLLNHATNSANNAEYSLTEFHHWNYKSYSLWGKPIISFAYTVNSLPESKTLFENIEFLSRFVNASSSIY